MQNNRLLPDTEPYGPCALHQKGGEMKEERLKPKIHIDRHIKDFAEMDTEIERYKAEIEQLKRILWDMFYKSHKEEK